MFLLFLVLLSGLVNLGSAHASDISERLEAEGFRIASVSDLGDDQKRFVLYFSQPINHEDAQAGSFDQKVFLIRKDAEAPVVLQTAGYFVKKPRIQELTRMLMATQVTVEHRFFGESKPKVLDWQYLTVQQSAADHHAIVVALKNVFGASSWVSTGASKGGMTATYHRMYYPDDVDATVAYVAPLNVSRLDPRYIDFLARVGNAECRAKVRVFQQEVLKRRLEMDMLLLAWERQNGLLLGSEGYFPKFMPMSVILDIAVAEYGFQFWQYGNLSECKTLPAAEASSGALFQALVSKFNLKYLTVGGLDLFRPYFVQAVKQLGYPGLALGHLDGLLYHDPNDYNFYLGDFRPGAFEASTVLDVEYWARTSASEILYINGEIDPWRAGAYPLNSDVVELIVKGGNHGADIGQLDANAQERAVALLSEWLQVPVEYPILEGDIDDAQLETDLFRL